jgi:hypothetical protein
MLESCFSPSASPGGIAHQSSCEASRSHTGGPRLGSGVVDDRAMGLRNTSSAPRRAGQPKVIDGFGSRPSRGI